MNAPHLSKKRAVGRGSRNVAALIRSVSLFFAGSGSRGQHAMRTDGRAPRQEAARRPASHFSKQETEALNLIYDRLVGEAVHSTSTASPPSSPRQQETEALNLIYDRLVGEAVHSTSTASPPSSPRQQRKEGVERAVFRDLLHSTFGVSTEEILMDRIFSVFDLGSDGLVRRDEWIIGCSVFLKGTLEERAAFAFAVYDLNSDGFIVREEMFTLLRNSLVKQPGDEDPDEGVKDLVELVMRKLDMDRDGKVSYQDFRAAVLEEPLFLEAFGQCLPAEQAAAAFLATLS